MAISFFWCNRMKRTGTKRIKSERLVLRKMHLFDYFYFVSWFRDESLTRFSQGKARNTRYDTFRFLLQRVYNYYFKRKNEYYFWCISKKGKMIGFIEVRALENEGDYWLYYMVSPSEQSKGYATEAVINASRYMKTQNINRLFGACDTENTASYKVLQKSGMTYVNHTEDVFHYRDGRTGARELFCMKMCD